MARRKLLFGNWKMNKTIAESREFAKESVKLLAFANEKESTLVLLQFIFHLQQLKKKTQN